MKNLLIRYRCKKLLTQDQLAKESGVARRTIVNIERGLNKPSKLVMFKLAAYFECEPEDIFPDLWDEESKDEEK